MHDDLHSVTLVDKASKRLIDAVARAIDHGRRSNIALRVIGRWDDSTRVVVRDGRIDASIRNEHAGLTVTVYNNGGIGVSTTTLLDSAGVEDVVEEARRIAGRVQSDEPVYLAEPAWLAIDGPQPELHCPQERDIDVLFGVAQGMEEAALAVARPDGVSLRVAEAGATAGEGTWVLGTTSGLLRHSAHSIHGRWCLALIDDDGDRIQDMDQASSRRVADLDHRAVAVRAARRTLARRGARSLSSRRTAALFDARIAATLIHNLVGALTGPAQMSGGTYLRRPLGKAVAADHIDLVEDPFVPLGLASGGFDSEGVAGSRRSIVASGIARGLFLDARAARKLAMSPTGNADGPYNLHLTSQAPGGDDAAMMRRLDTGLLVTELLGGASDPVRGTWTYAANGFWVERGIISYPVRDITLAGDMPTMLKQIVAIGSDSETFGAVRTGPILIETIEVSGA